MSSAVISDFENAMRAAYATPVPPGTHWSWIAGPTTAAGHKSALVVWADHPPGSACPQCGHTLDRAVGASPVSINLHSTGPDDQFLLGTQTHGCGERLHVKWAFVEGTDEGGRITGADVTAALGRMSEWLEEETEKRAEVRYAQLKENLRRAVPELERALEEGETYGQRACKIATGGASVPGLWCFRGAEWKDHDKRLCDPRWWEAWDYAPDGSGEMMTVVFANLEDED
jgi:hypothetical protein